MTDGAELRLSDSAISSYLRCAYAYLLGYVHRIKGPPTQDMTVGRAVHAGIEAHWKGKDPWEAFGAEMAGNLALIPDLVPALASGAVLDGRRALGAYLDHVAPTFTPTLVEAPFQIRVDGVLVSGVIDAADADVHDTKTTSTPSKVVPERHRLQLTIYRWGYRALTGRFPGRLLLDIVGRNGRWAQKTVELDDQGMADVVGLVATGIGAGNFEPTGAVSGACRFCPYANPAVCRYVRFD